MIPWNELRCLQVLNILFFGSNTIMFNYFSYAGYMYLDPIYKITERYESSLTLPGWTYSIWGFIYTSLTIFLVAQFFFTDVVKNIGYYFVGASIFKMTWILNYTSGNKVNLTVALFCIYANLYCLQKIQHRIKNIKDDIEWTLCVVPFDVYKNWVTAFSVLNICTTLEAYRFIPSDMVVYIIGLLCISLALLYNFLKHERFISLVVLTFVNISLITKNKDENVYLWYTVCVVFMSVIVTIVKLWKRQLVNEVESNETNVLYEIEMQ